MDLETLKKLYVEMLRIRKIEEAFADRYKEQQMRCPMHLSIGQEAVAVGVCQGLRKDDIVFSGHRAHAHYLAKGGDLKALVAELYGRATGCSGGRGGSMHLVDKRVSFLGSTAIVGGTVPLAVGTAWAARHKGEDTVSAVFFGDGCFEEGVLHESLNYACLKSLPVIFICENNGYSVFTSIAERQPDRRILDVAKAHGCGVHSGDGNDASEVYQLAKQAIAAARNGEGPQFLEFETYRWLEHCGPDEDDHLNYRPATDVQHWKAHCPVHVCEGQISNTTTGLFDWFGSMERQVTREIEDAFEFALSSPPPDARTLSNYVYAE